MSAEHAEVNSLDVSSPIESDLTFSYDSELGRTMWTARYSGKRDTRVFLPLAGPLCINLLLVLGSSTEHRTVLLQLLIQALQNQHGPDPSTYVLDTREQEVGGDGDVALQLQHTLGGGRRGLFLRLNALESTHQLESDQRGLRFGHLDRHVCINE